MAASPRRFFAGLLTALLVGTGVVAVTAAPSYAAACTQGTGVTVVVDGNQLGGLSTTCVPGGGRSAGSAFSAAGVSMSYAARQPGFVCRVQGKPSNAPCVNASPANAYWSLWVSDGKGSWSFSSVGVGSLSVPQGGWVAWSWQGQSGKSAPSVKPVGAAAPAPKPQPTKKPATAAPTSSAPSAKASASASARASAKASASASAKAKAAREEAAASPGSSDAPGTDGVAGSSDSGATSDDETRAASAETGAPWATLVGLAAVLVLLGVAGVVAWRRRSSTS